MARHIHLLGDSGYSACCQRSPATLGLGSILTDDPEAVTCPRYERPEPPQEGLKLREGDQQLPVRREGVRDVQSQVISDIVKRREVGVKRYGTPLQPHNGRDALQDLYEELLDGVMYVKQYMLERDDHLGRIAELEAELASR